MDKKVHKNNHRFTCSDKCLVHLLSCNVFQRQYNGQNVNEFSYRWDNYKNNNRKSLKVDDHNQAGIFANFQNLDHKGFLEDTEIAFIDKTNPSNFTRPEEFWIDTSKTRFPLGLNNLDTYHWMYLYLFKSLMYLRKIGLFLRRSIF